MKLGFFLQNDKKGGLDTFVKNLLNNWPEKKDFLYLFCNVTHSGFLDLQKDLKNKNIFLIKYDFDLNQDIKKKYNSLIFKIIKFFFFYINFVRLKKKILNLFYLYKLDKLLIVSGGYPAGEACLAAAVSWYNFSGKKAWFNFHNFVLKSNFYDFLKNKIDREISSSIKGFISVSKVCSVSIFNRKIFRNHKSIYIYNGLKTYNLKTNFNVRKRFKIFKKKKIILMLGVYEKRKGHDFLFKSLEFLNNFYPNFYCIICGDGNFSEISKLRLAVPDNIRKKIKILNHVKYSHSLIKQSDLVVIPSQSYESFSYVALEAMCFSKPVVATNVGGLIEVVKNNETGYIVDKNDPIKFANKISSILNDKKISNFLGKNGRIRFIKKFKAENMANSYNNIIKR
jgi:glycosyltransferase involved in cell wall biosynthesis